MNIRVLAVALGLPSSWAAPRWFLAGADATGWDRAGLRGGAGSIDQHRGTRRRPSAPADASAPAGEPRAGAPRGPRRPSAAAGAAAESPAPAAEAAPVAGLLRIDSDVPGAQVFIDRQFIGATPVTAENLTPGTHQLNVSAEGFDGIARTIEVEAGARDLMVRFKEVRLDVRLPVVHRHRMGSCNGTLVATPQGLRYETDDKDDCFAASFADLEAFQVDYTEKNLRVRVRKGKQYNFTDPDRQRRQAVRLPPRRGQGAAAPRQRRHRRAITER